MVNVNVHVVSWKYLGGCSHETKSNVRATVNQPGSWRLKPPSRALIREINQWVQA